MSKNLLIVGSARRNGNTHKLATYLATNADFDLIDLLDYNIGHFDYTHQNANDDFIPLMRSITTKYNTFIFATPVYWYAMSGLMKTFFDRISDLLKTEKDLGRTLRGKSMGMISCSDRDDRNKHFAEPFELTADYLGMTWLGDAHGFLNVEGELSLEVSRRLDKFKS